MSNLARWRGLKAILVDVVEHGSRAVERVQKETAARPFAILEAIPATSVPARGVHAVHDATVTGVHTVLREINRAVSLTVDVALDAAESSERDAPGAGKGS